MTPPAKIAMAFVLAALAASPVLAAATAAPDAAPKPAPVLKLLPEAGVDFKRLIPPPPAANSDLQKAEMAEVERVYRTTPAARKTQAQWDNDHEDASLYTTTLGLDPTQLPLTGALLADAVNDQEIATDAAKAFFARPRPWALDTTIVPCDAAPGKKTNTSYPSGHAGIGYVTGAILADLLPERAEAIMARAQDYAFNREVCGDHFASDTEASHALANAIASEILADPALGPRLNAARAELRAALHL